MPNYAFLRREMPNYSNLRAAGWDVPLFAYDDPRLAQQVEAARGAGSQYGIWADPHGRSPEEYARLMAGLSQRYNPNIMVPDIEFIGKGDQGSPGWQYNQQLAQLWKQYLPNQRTAVSVMPNQTDFNYEAWNGIASEWLPQAYGANPLTDIYNPQDIIDTLVRRGVDPNIISPVLGPGHKAPYGGAYSLWTADDWIAGQLPQAGKRQSVARQMQSAMPSQVARRPKLSQSAEQVGNQGLKWFGQSYDNAEAFRAALSQRGQSYSDWAKNHPTAAAALNQRPVTRRPSTRAS
jgi:hypothetical protein